MGKLHRDLLTVEDAAQELGISGRAVLHRIAKGQLQAEKIGPGRTSAYLIDRQDLDSIQSPVQDELRVDA